MATRRKMVLKPLSPAKLLSKEQNSIDEDDQRTPVSISKELI